MTEEHCDQKLEEMTTYAYELLVIRRPSSLTLIEKRQYLIISFSAFWSLNDCKFDTSIIELNSGYNSWVHAGMFSLFTSIC